MSVTGASSGFGKALTDVLLREGDIVVATLRKPSVLEPLTKQYPPAQLLVLRVDVTRPTDISAAFAITQVIFGRIDVVFNNAGYGIFGEVESVPDAEARALFDINFWGVVDVSRAAVKFFREVNPPGKGGILLQHSSIMSFLGGSGGSYYCASKHDLHPQTGGFDTNTIAASKILPMHSAYADTLTATLREARDGASFDGDPYKFADMLYRLVESIEKGQKIPLFFPIGEDALDRLQVRLGKMAKLVEDVAPWSADLKKDPDMTKAKL